MAFVQQHRQRLRWAEGVSDEGARVGVPGDDVNFLAAEFVDNVLNARATHAHTAAHRFHARLQGGHSHLGTITGLASESFDFHNALADFRHLLLQQTAEHVAMPATELEHRPAVAFTHFHQISANATVTAIALIGQLLFFGQHSFRLLQVDDHVACAGHIALHPAHNDLAFLLGEMFISRLALGFSDALHDDLLGGLGGDASEIVRRAIHKDSAADLGLRVYGLSLSQGKLHPRIGDLLHHLFLDVDEHLSGHRVNLRLNAAARHAILAPISRCQGGLDGFQDDLFGQSFFRRQVVDGCYQLVFHHYLSLLRTCLATILLAGYRSMGRIQSPFPLQQEKWGAPTFPARHLRVVSPNRVDASFDRFSTAETAEHAEKTKESLRAPWALR